MNSKQQTKLDYAGALASWICAAHCIGLPFLVYAGVFAGVSFLSDEVSERIMIGISVLIACAAFVPALRRHGRYVIVPAFAVGLALIASADRVAGETAAKIPMVITGAGFITGAHLLNRKFDRAASMG